MSPATPTPPPPVPSAPPRSQAQRIGDLTRERDRACAELISVKKLLGRIREATFQASSAGTGFDRIRQLLVDNWQETTPPGRVFDLMRSFDSSGKSGTGRVAEGIEFENGKVALCWLGPTSSVNVYDSIEHVIAIHGHGNSTEVVYR